MKAIVILAAIAVAHSAKLEKTYLPPSNARTAGGSANFLETPLPGPSTSQNRNVYSPISQNANEFLQNGNRLSHNGIDFSGNKFAPSDNGFARVGNGFTQAGAEYDNLNAFNNFQTRPERPRATFERNAAILRQDNSNDGETFSYAYETENGIYAEENGVATNGVEAQGGYSYTGDDGQIYTVRYTADQNGFVPQGDHLPTPPPVPEEIMRALEQNARDEAAGIYDDGSYREDKYSNDNSKFNGQFNYQNQNSNYQNANTNAFNGNDEDTVVTNSAVARAGNVISQAYGTPNYNARNNAGENGPIYNTPRVAYNAPRNVAPVSDIINAANSPFNANAALNANASARTVGAEKAYLPPFPSQRNVARNGSRRPSFNSKTGYRY